MMIKELEGNMTVELLNKYFWHRKITKLEMQKEIELYKMFKEFNKKVHDDEEDIFSYDEWFEYLENFGYYILVDGDPGKCLPYLDSYGLEKEKAFISIINNYLSMNAIRYELDNRKKLSNDFQERFGIYGFNILDKKFNSLEFFDNYFTCLYFLEYNIDKWDKYYDGNIPVDMIKYYEEDLNNNWWSKEKNLTWEYDSNTKKFNCKRNIKVRKLEN